MSDRTEVIIDGEPIVLETMEWGELYCATEILWRALLRREGEIARLMERVGDLEALVEELKADVS